MKGLNKYKGLLYLGLLVIVAPLLAYRYALGETVSQWANTRKILRQAEQLRQAERTVPTGQEAAIYSDDSEMIRSGLLVAELLPVIESGNLTLEHFSPFLTSSQNGIILTTGQISVQGRFSGIVRLIDNIEREILPCKMISVRFHTVKPRNRGGAKTLNCTIYVQQIVINNLNP